MMLHEWAARWGIPYGAIAELQNLYSMNGTSGDDDAAAAGKSEAFAQSQVMLEGAEKGVRLWRNNVGVLKDINGRPVRYGLANQSKSMNEQLKSGDLIGVRTKLIAPEMVGTYIGQFVSREMKEPGWKYTGDEHEEGQLRWAMLINSIGGDAAFATGPGTL